MNNYDKMLVSGQGLQDRLDEPRLRVFDATAYADLTPSGLIARNQWLVAMCSIQERKTRWSWLKP